MRCSSLQYLRGRGVAMRGLLLTGLVLLVPALTVATAFAENYLLRSRRPTGSVTR